MQLLRKVFIVSIAALAFSGSTAAHAFSNLITNGSFESQVIGGSYTTLNAGDGTLTGWTISGHSVELIRGYWQPSQGYQSLDMSGNGPGAISQTFNTTAGQQYQVKFDLAGNPDQAYDKILLASAGNITNALFNFTQSGNSNMGWLHQQFLFTATGTQSTLTFAAGPTMGPWGPALDNVSVTATPIPAALPLIASGLAVLGLLRRRRA